MYYILLHILHSFTYITYHYIILHALHYITCITYITYYYIILHALHALHCITYYYIYYIKLHDITSYYTGGAGLARLPPAQPQRPHIPRPAAPSGDPSMLIGKLCAALQAGPEAYNKAATAWRAKFPVAALLDPRKDFLVCAGSQGQAERMRGPANFSRSFAEFMAGWMLADISYAKGGRMLEVATNVRFNPEHFPSMSLRTLEQKLVKTIFPNGHRTADLTRPEDGDQKIIFHYIPFTEVVRRQLSRRAFAGHQYLEYEPQKCPRNPRARGFGRVNSGTWFEAAQYRANQLVAAAGVRETKYAVAGLVWVSDSSFGGKNTSWHGVYGAYKARNLSEGSRKFM